MSYPKEVKAFTEWAKAMVAGATVERPKLKGFSAQKRKRRGKRYNRAKRRIRQTEE